MARYLRLLERMHESGILFWCRNDFPSTPLQRMANKLQLTLFAVSKTPNTDRLISWSCIINQLCSDPLEPDFPYPSLFAQVRSIGSIQSAIYMDVNNMFHNGRLSPQLADLFPLPTILLSQLPTWLQTNLQNHLVINANCNPTLHPSQATTPVGFRWSISMGYYAAPALIAKSLRIITMHDDAANVSSRPNFLCKSHPPITLPVDLPLVCHIIDYVTIIAIYCTLVIL